MRLWIHDEPRSWPDGWSEMPNLQQGYAEPPPEPETGPPDWKKDEKTGLYLPEGATKQKQQAGFGAKWK